MSRSTNDSFVLLLRTVIADQDTELQGTKNTRISKYHSANLRPVRPGIRTLFASSASLTVELFLLPLDIKRLYAAESLPKYG